MNAAKELTKEEVLAWEHCLTVGKLKKYLASSTLPDDAPVMIQRTPDRIFHENGMGTFRLEVQFSHQMRDYNREWDTELTDEDKAVMSAKYTEEEISAAREEYIIAWGLLHTDREGMLFIDTMY